MARQKNRILYIFFYGLFSVETWRILMGIIMASLLGPRLMTETKYGIAAQIVVWAMIFVVGYTICSRPARYISKGLRRLFTGNRA